MSTLMAAGRWKSHAVFAYLDPLLESTKIAQKLWKARKVTEAKISDAELRNLIEEESESDEETKESPTKKRQGPSRH